MKFNLFDDTPEDFYPLTLTRPIADLRVGITCIREKWESMIKGTSGYMTSEYLQEKYPMQNSDLYINARWIPQPEDIDLIAKLQPGSGIGHGEMTLAVKTLPDQSIENITDLEDHPGAPFVLSRVTDLFAANERAMVLEFESSIVDGQTKSENTLYGNNFHIDPSAQVRGAILNSETGPIYIGPNAQVMEGSLIRGPFALLEGAHVKMGSKIYGATTIGPYSRVGGEISNSILQGYSNKGHDGFLGNSLLGHWCNLGADTNNSNLKNNYSTIKVWSYATEGYMDTGLTFCGLIMGDHSKSAINTQFNTGTIVGVNVNVFDSGFPPKFIPSFSWGGATGFVEYDFDKAMEVCERVCARRDVKWTDEDVAMMRHIHDKMVRRTA